MPVAAAAAVVLAAAAVACRAKRAASPEERARAAAQAFLGGYLGGDGRVARSDQGGDTVSEGQAYAMLVAAAIGDRQRFDLAWHWTQVNLRRPDGLLSWRWQGGKIVDPQPASDADLDAARALIVAAQRFEVDSYRREALRIGAAVLATETVDAGGRLVLVAGPWATSAPRYVNPSYFSPAAFAALGTASGDRRWDAAAGSARDVLRQLAGSAPGVPPDWALLDAGGGVQAAGAPNGGGGSDGGGGGPVYGYDAARTFVRMAEDCSGTGRQWAAQGWPFLKEASGDSAGMAAAFSLAGHRDTAATHPIAYVAAAGAATAAGDRTSAASLLGRAEGVQAASPSYYGAAWVALGRILLTTNWLGGCGA